MKGKYVALANEDRQRYEEECHKRDLEVEEERANRKEESLKVGKRRKTNAKNSYSEKAYDRELRDICREESQSERDDDSDTEDEDDKLKIEQILAMDK